MLFLGGAEVQMVAPDKFANTRHVLMTRRVNCKMTLRIPCKKYVTQEIPRKIRR